MTHTGKTAQRSRKAYEVSGRFGRDLGARRLSVLGRRRSGKTVSRLLAGGGHREVIEPL
ncbi:MAG TPA: hypothetical protein VFR79_05705 [Nitrospira sp.]|nr:hypothetical protein [Nitrospira sp.]